MRPFLAALILSLWPVAALAQATLVADRVEVEGERAIVAEGGVEVLFEGTRLRARRIRYDAEAERLQIEGPITLVDGPDIIVIADAAELDPDLRDGIMTGARMVLDQQLQLAALEIARVGGRYTQLFKTVASSCQVCSQSEVPLWQIRARRVIHDQQERQIYFEGAQFRVVGVPVMYLPRLRLPDPTLERSSGFLVPRIRNNSRLGFGIKVPYFVTLGDHADLTFTPYVSALTRTLELRYRQAFVAGDIFFEGAVSRDDLRVDETNAYLFADGRFDLPRGFQLTFDVELTSDPAYLLEYDYSDKDRLDSALAIGRIRRDEFIDLRIVNFRTLRAAEIPFADELPYLLGEAVYERRYEDGPLGGDGRWQINALGYQRQSDENRVGRDALRLGGRADWARSWILDPGIIAKLQGFSALDFYLIGQDDRFARRLSHVTPTIAGELRWPLERVEAGGATQILEPVVQAAWTDTIGADVPNEDSTLVEFDEGNLFSLNRYPGSDLYERGLRVTAALGWTRIDPGGWSLGVTGGRVYRGEALGQFTEASGLDGLRSDWLAAAQFRLGDRLSLNQRILINDDLSVTRAEARIDWRGRDVSLGSSYVYLIAEEEEDRPDRVSELATDASWRIDRNWTGRADLRYDFAAAEAAKAGVGVEYRNECIALELSLSRRFTSSTRVEPTTDVGLTVALAGFGTEDGRPYRRRCGG